MTWEMAFLYAVVFGGFVAFANYLPTYIKTIYGSPRLMRARAPPVSRWPPVLARRSAAR